MNDAKLDGLERNLHDLLRFHREQYEKQIKPIIDQLMRLQSLRPRSFIVTKDQIDSFAIHPGTKPEFPGEVL